jgi:hypothetical protein
VTGRLAAAFCLFVFIIRAVSAGGKAEEPPVYSDTWTLCVTGMVTEGLVPARAAVGTLALQTVVRSLAAVDRRVRFQPEEVYYRDQVWFAARKEAAKKIAEKQARRDALIYQGDKGWKYRKEVKKIDAELVVLREELAKAEANVPLIEGAPRFALTADNLSYKFPAAPKPGKEFSFCKQQNVDGFLLSTLTEFHERLVLDVRLYSLFARSYTYEDSVIFSTEDIDDALMELTDRIIEHISQLPPAGLFVTAEPDNALITVNGRFAGRGESDFIERNAGPASVEVFADGHGSYSETLDLPSGEITELSVRLPPLPIAGITVNTDEPAALYQGALYIGETPFTLFAPFDTRISLAAETRDKRSASTAVLVDNSVSAVTLKPVSPPQGNAVDRARRGFYGAWGRFWIALPVALVLNGMYSSYVSAYNTPSGIRTEEDYNTALMYQYATIGAAVTAGIFGAEFAARLFYYVHVSNRERSPLVPSAPPPEAMPVPQADVEVALETVGETETDAEAAPEAVGETEAKNE